MKYEIKTVGKNSIQITTTDERYYQTTDEKTKVTTFVPSVTWICSHYPKGIGFMKWLASKGWDEAEAIKESAGHRGSRVHQAVEDLNNGAKILHNQKFHNEETGTDEELTGEEYEAIVSYSDWFKATNPKILKAEHSIITSHYGGTIDLIAEIDKQKWIIDIKTSQYIWPAHKLQVSAYKHAMKVPEDYKMAILSVGYNRNKNKYKFTEIDDKIELFRAAYKIWEEEVSQKSPPQVELPLSIDLKIKK